MVFYVFGYGSLIFRPPPHTISRTEGYVKPYVRRFCQSSNDHRGTPERPGRVVTLVRAADWEKETGESHGDDESDLRVWGVALEIDPAHEKEVRDDLDHREKNGYTCEEIDLYHLVDGKEEVKLSNVTVYIGRPDNEAFVGKYLFNLCKAIHDLEGAPVDEYLFQLEAAVQRLQAEELALQAPKVLTDLESTVPLTASVAA